MILVEYLSTFQMVEGKNRNLLHDTECLLGEKNYCMSNCPALISQVGRKYFLHEMLHALVNVFSYNFSEACRMQNIRRDISGSVARSMKI
jgi:hypothetical protein